MQFLPVVVDKLAREDDEAFEAQFPALMQEERKLRGESGGRRVVRLAGGIEGDAGLGGVGDHKAQLRLARAVEELFPIALWVETAGGRGNDARCFHRLAVLAAAQDQGVEPVLLAEAIGRLGVTAAGLHQHDLGVKAGFLVQLIDKVVGKGAKEIALAELHDFFGGVFKQKALIALFFQSFKRQSFHNRILFTD